MRGQSPKPKSNPEKQESSLVSSNVNTFVKANKKPRLTHFLCLPIGHHEGLRKKWSQVSASLLASSPAISGLDESIVLKPGGLHLTLGVLSLASRRFELTSEPVEEVTIVEETLNGAESEPIDVLPSSVNDSVYNHTVGDALSLLQSLRAPLADIITDKGELMVPLRHMDVMRNKLNQKLEQSHVMWAGPDPESEEGRQLTTTCELIHSTFKNAGMLQDDRPLKLHCTLINTVYRKDKNSGKGKKGRWKKRIPFSYEDILQSPAIQELVIDKKDSSILTGGLKIDLGSWRVDELQLCEMGSKDADGVYKSIGAISLRNL